MVGSGKGKGGEKTLLWLVWTEKTTTGILYSKMANLGSISPGLASKTHRSCCSRGPRRPDSFSAWQQKLPVLHVWRLVLQAWKSEDLSRLASSFQKATGNKQWTVASDSPQGRPGRSLNDAGDVKPTLEWKPQDGDTKAVRCPPRKGVGREGGQPKQEAVCAAISRAGRVGPPESPGIWVVLPHVPNPGPGTEGFDVSHSWFQSCFDLIFPCIDLMSSFLNGDVSSVPSYIESL